MELKLKMSHMLSISNDNAANFYVTDFRTLIGKKYVCIFTVTALFLLLIISIFSLFC